MPTSVPRASATRVTARRLPSPAPPPGERGPGEAAAHEPARVEASRNDWLPWFLSIFGAACAAFVLVMGVLPAREENAHLIQQVARLESAVLNANTERTSQEQARAQLEVRQSSAQAQLQDDSAGRQKQKQLRDTARQELTQTFVDQFEDGSMWLEQRGEQLVILVQNTLLFHGDRTEVTRKGRQFLSALAEILKHQPAEQVFQIGAHTDQGSTPKSARRATKEGTSAGTGRLKTSWELSARRAANVARFLEERAGLPGQQLVAAGFSSYRPAVPAANGATPEKNRRIEIVLLAGKS